MATSKVEALEAEATSLRRDIIVAMDESNSSKEKIKALTEELDVAKQQVKQKDEVLVVVGQKMKNAMAKVVYAFQTTDEYNAILFGWYFKGFELLIRYMVKHGSGVDLEDLDFEAVDKEIEEDEAAQAAPAAGDDPQDPEKDVDDAYALQFSLFLFIF